MPVVTLIRPSEIEDDVFDLDLGIIQQRDPGIPGIFLSPTINPEKTCTVASITCGFTCGGLTGRPCAC